MSLYFEPDQHPDHVLTTFEIFAQEYELHYSTQLFIRTLCKFHLTQQYKDGSWK